MEKEAIRQYFDTLAPDWDRMEIKSEPVIEEILTNARIRGDLSLLDVACGTGILFPYYRNRGLTRITGLDLSREMLKVARSKFPQPEIALIAGDAECFAPGVLYDRIMLYNAFPHFLRPERVTQNLYSLLKPGGIFSVAHGMSRQQINLCHQGSASRVSIDLLPAEALAGLFPREAELLACVDSDLMYQVCVRKPAISG